jgi:phosphopantothenoylcysteine synthetase/decarboxylase
MRVLITSGATREPIDGVRFITNFSTGLTGAALAERFLREGCEVVYLHGAAAARPSGKARLVEFESFGDLDMKLRAELKGRRFDAIVHLAAVSDYSVRSVSVGSRRCAPGKLAKIDSSREVSIRLKRNPKILDRLRGYAGRAKPMIAAFKLTHGADARHIEEAVRRLAGKADIVVHNDLAEFDGGRSRSFHIYEAGRKVADCRSRAGLAARLLRMLRKEKRDALDP